MSRLGTPLLLTLLFSACIGTLGQQAEPKQSVPRFSVRTELVSVPVVVQRHGQHVTGLLKPDFEIQEDGKTKAIASFEEVRLKSGQGGALKPIVPPAGTYTNEVMTEGPVSYLVILLDLINTPYLDQAPAKKKLLEFLQRDYRGDRATMLVALHPDGLRILHEFTTDPKVLMRIVARLGSSHEVDIEAEKQARADQQNSLYNQIDFKKEADDIEREFIGNPSGQQAGFEKYKQVIEYDRRHSTLLALQQIAHSLASLQGMKSLVWVTGGVIIPPTMDSAAVRLSDTYLQTWKVLSTAGVAIYPIDAVTATPDPGLTGPEARLPGLGSAPLQGASSVQGVQNFMDLSKKTGGDYCILRKDPDTCFRHVIDSASEYYLLTYYAQPSETAHWRKIEVKVHGAGLQVHARTGYFSTGTADSPDDRRKHDIAQAFITPIEYRGLPISVRWTDPGGRTSSKDPAADLDPKLSKRGPKRPFVLGISADALTIDSVDNNHIDLDVVAVALGSDGKVKADSTQQLNLHLSAKDLERLRARGFAYANALEVPPHSAKVRFIVRDNLSERIGTLSVPIEAQAEP